MQKVDAHVISLANQKGGTAKTTTCANLGIHHTFKSTKRMDMTGWETV